MVLKMVSAAVLAALFGLGAANAQSAGDFGGPRELPPASFSGQQYVDSKGCVYLRAGFGGRTNWVPRVSRNRSQLCGYPPTFGNNQVAIADPAPQPQARAEVQQPAPVVRAAPAPVRVARRPLDTVASLTTPPRIRAVAPPVRSVAPSAYAPPAAVPVRRAIVPQTPVASAPRAQLAEREATGSGSGGGIGCYADAPVAERFRVQGGGTVVMCTRGDGDLANARAPRVLAGTAAVAPSGYLEGRDPASEVGRVVVSSQDRQVVPKGYRPAFEDDRLNPNRAKGTRQGWADQDSVWTREVPSRLVEDVARKKARTAGPRKIYVSSKSAGASQPSGAARRYVQVGTFGEPSNAKGASSRLSRLGLPVARSKTTKGGRSLQIVMAGPFASADEAKAALSAARRAGFGDAFIR